MKIFRDLLPLMTRLKFTIKWTWQGGDIVVWDNRCSMLAATLFDNENPACEMWRLTLLDSGRETA